jgi:transposase InsO family protein
MDRTVSMDTRLAIALARRVDGERLNVTALAAELGTSRQSFYVYERRFAAEGLVGLLPRSRAPHRHPNQTPAEVEDLIEQWWHKLRGQGLDHGARSIWAWMRRHGEDPPSARTVHRVLVRRGLAKREPKKRPRKTFRRFTAAQPNGIWQIDGLETQLADGAKRVVIRVLDDHSRKILASVATTEENGHDAWGCVEKAIQRHGPPAMFLSDNGLAFNGSRKGKLVLVERSLRQLGVSVVAASARHPQTCGKAEREHQTFERWLTAQPTPATTEQLQGLCDIYEALYNQDRPHQSLGDGTLTPDEAYHRGTKAVPATEPLTGPPRMTRVKVTARGEVSVGSQVRIQIGRGWEGAVLDVIRDGNAVALFHNQELIDTRIIDPSRRYQPNKHGQDGHRLPPRRRRTLSAN